jgi:hypothetical protein
MAKRIALGLLVLAAVTGVVGAQASSSAKMAVSLDTFPLVKGLIWTDSDADNSLFALAPSFEYQLRPHLTVGAAADLYFGKNLDTSVLYFGIAAHGRWYTQSSGLDKFFIDAGLGFNMFSYDGEFDSDDGGYSGFTMSLKAGYKLLFTPKFFVEPSMAFVYAKIPSLATVPTPVGWQPGLSIGITL